MTPQEQLTVGQALNGNYYDHEHRRRIWEAIGRIPIIVQTVYNAQETNVCEARCFHARNTGQEWDGELSLRMLLENAMGFNFKANLHELDPGAPFDVLTVERLLPTYVQGVVTDGGYFWNHKREIEYAPGGVIQLHQLEIDNDKLVYKYQKIVNGLEEALPFLRQNRDTNKKPYNALRDRQGCCLGDWPGALEKLYILRRACGTGLGQLHRDIRMSCCG